ncbi:hypothetical protein C7974DRAFT_41703 [Boeremia exigua]|uniref:uncharacterized protein n=1 Tax=Boeremia exigua TaxID=749465 RepID=UPI001E8E7E34|nr:uncharacterized protein C7974DRAFT_41703 [Boeremia exigua]KAH6616280.1 hypothetical protein C7974DRAFT_41703 [Boeremia exigua]
MVPREVYVNFLTGLTLDAWHNISDAWPLHSVVRRLTGDLPSTIMSRRLADTTYGMQPVICTRLSRKTLFATRQGRLCLVSTYARVGDVIAVLASCNLPMILRSKGNDWTAVAPAYVKEPDNNDVMSGLLWSKLLAEGTALQRFTLL